MKRVTSDETASRQPAALEGAVSGHCLERILGAGGSESAVGRQRGRDGYLVATDERSQGPTRQLQEPGHDSPGTENGLAPGEELRPQRVEAGGVGLAPGPDNQIPGGLLRLDIPAPHLAQLPAQTIAGHRGRLMLGNDQSHPWLARLVVHPNHVHVFETAAAALGEAAANVRRARKPVGSRQARRIRQEPPCFDGSETVSCLRPFFRRRESTARPQRVAMRARNPCLLTRRLLRGR